MSGRLAFTLGLASGLLLALAALVAGAWEAIRRLQRY